MGDVKVNEDTASVENNDAPVENGTNNPEVQNEKENKEVAETEKVEKEPKASENSSTKMEVDEDDSKLSSEDKEAEEVPLKEIPPVSKRKSRSSRSSSSNSLPPNASSPKQMETEDSKDVSSKPKDNEQPENAKVNNKSDDEADFFGFDPPTDNDKCTVLIKALNRFVESLNRVEESDDFMGFDTDTSDIHSKSNDVDSIDSHADVTMNETEYTEGLMAPLSAKKTPRSVKKSVNVDLSNPEFKKPFEYGWVRELVYRSTSDSNIRRNADIYYYTPTGKKVRSSREILEFLTGSDLTLDNFTFFKEPIGLNNPAKEIIREAKAKPGPRGIEDGTPPVKKLTPKVKLTTPSTPSNTSKFSSTKENAKASLTPKVVFKGNAAKNRINSGKNKLDKKRKSAGPDDVDIIMESAEWSPDQKIKTNGVKRPLDSPEDDSLPPPEKKQKQSRKQGSQSPDCVSSHSAKDDGPNFMQNLNAGFIGLLHTFQYLKVYELLRAACVSRMWNFVASHTSLWETVRMKNSKVRDWNGFGRTLLKHGTRTLDLRKMIVPDTIEEQAHMWEELSLAVKNVKSLTKVDMGRCSPAALSLMAEAAPQLKSLISLAIRANELDLAPFTKLTNLTELKLKAAQNGIEIKNFECLKELKNLTSLALTTVKNLDGIEEYLPTGLVSLELGECSTLSPEMATQTLPKLTNLVRLRLEKGQNDCPTIALLNAIAGLPNLVQLELINFDVKPGFDKALAKCTNIQTLLIIPTYVTQSATTNHVVMGGVAKLSHSLNYFIWGLTLELLKVTDLFIGQVENQKGNKPIVPKKGSGDSIPILKPATDGEPKEGGQPSQVDILALPNLQRVLTTLLPQTKIKILKVPFSATWRQTVTDA
ncbi:unnamed protein product [Nezara viridula]|uniref:MBD domain-containing protein n=1 Tax=Nezara viridula TaxID=85310 RepID=A0A9P0H1I2_NEZVI|nr:unnamed protein product [Nezara viridula]